MKSQLVMVTLVGSALVGGLSYIPLVQGAPRTPPPEALAACASQAQDSQCRVQTPHGTLNGYCRPIPTGQIACVPEGAPPQGAAPQGNGLRPPEMSGGRGQGGMGMPPMRTHTVTQSSGRLTLVPATQEPIAANQVSIDAQANQRVLSSNGIAAHRTGAFPNAGNPNSISAQRYGYRVPLKPSVASKVTPLRLGKFGLAVNGVPFDPGAAETYQGAPSWNYEALSGAVALGLDANYAHVQPTGAYHYHGKPLGLMQALGVNAKQHSPLIGWAADGFPIYALYGYSDAKQADSGIATMTSSYRVKQGQRKGVSGGEPSGRYDGTFVNDYEYSAGAGTLDECNGRITVTPEFPNGTYAYFITEKFPVIPRCFKGTPSADFNLKLPGMR